MSKKHQERPKANQFPLLSRKKKIKQEKEGTTTKDLAKQQQDKTKWQQWRHTAQPARRNFPRIGTSCNTLGIPVDMSVTTTMWRYHPLLERKWPYTLGTNRQLNGRIPNRNIPILLKRQLTLPLLQMRPKW
jgi:hypothetical protein